VPHRSYQGATYLPLATVAPGHRFCDDKYTIMPDTSSLQNRASGRSVRMAVCGKCVSNQYTMHPSHTSGGKVFGVCKPLSDHTLFHEMATKCSDVTAAGCSLAYPMPLQCQEFVGGKGEVEWPGYHGYNVDVNADSPVEGRAIAFTCVQVATVQFATTISDVFTHGVIAASSGKVYQMVRGDLAECHSESEADATNLQMACVNKGIVKGCYMKDIDNGAHDSKAESAAAYETKKAEAFAQGIGDGWAKCDTLTEKNATSVSRL